MKKYLFLFRFEMKTIFRDPINGFLLGFPFLLLLLTAYVLPKVIRSANFIEAMMYQSMILLMVILMLAMGIFMVAAMATFLLLDHKDEHTLHTIAATPVGLTGYLTFKLSYVYLLTVLSNLLVMFGTKWLAGDAYVLGGVRLLDKMSTWDMLFFAFASALFAPSLALLQSALAKNKVEGFAWIKGAGIIAMVPFLLALPTFQNGLQYLLGVFPNFWAVKAMMTLISPTSSPANLSYAMYHLIGIAYNLAILYYAFRMFLKKQQY